MMHPAHVVFRADASLRIGNGHVMRCLALANALRSAGSTCHFICSDTPGNLGAEIERCGHALTLVRQPGKAPEALLQPVDPPHWSWLDGTWEQDAAFTHDVLRQLQANLVVVDHYALDARWERELRSSGARLLAIDDLGDRSHDCDLLLDQNLGRSYADYRSLVPERCRVLAGPAYALLRPGFAEHRALSLRRRAAPQLKRLLVTMGGVDKDNMTEKVLRSLIADTLPPDCLVSIVLGAHAPWVQEVRSAAHELPFASEVLLDVRDMESLMTACDLAIGAAGSTAWERCCLGLPSLVLILAENQRLIGHALEASGSAMLVRDDGALEDELRRSLRLAAEPEIMRVLSQRASAVCDGLGVQRVSKEIFQHE